MGYLVTGAAGFIGSYVVRQLLDEGEHVVSLDRSFDGATDFVLGDHLVGATRYQGDVTDLALLIRVCQAEGVDRIIHLAGELHASSATNPGQCISSNIVGTHNVLEVGRLLPISRIVTASSAAVFGHPRHHPPGPIANDARHHPADAYEASKVFNEHECAFYAKAFDVDCVSLRIGLAYGHGCRIGWAARFVDELVVKPLRGEPGRVPWRESTMNWVYILDAADAFVRASRAQASGTIAYNLRGDPRTVADTVAVVRELIPGADVEAEPGEHEWAQNFDDTLFRRDTGYAARWPLEEGLGDIIERTQA